MWRPPMVTRDRRVESPRQKRKLERAINDSIDSLCQVNEVVVGVDVVDIFSLREEVESGGPSYLNRVFTIAEQQECGVRVDRLATRFAAKEAVAKLLGTGLRGIDWKDIEVQTEPSGKPTLVLYRTAHEIARRQGIQRISMSLAREAGLAVAVVAAQIRTQ